MFHPLPDQNLFHLLQKVQAKHVPFGFDACSTDKVHLLMQNAASSNVIPRIIRPCESTLFSVYINSLKNGYQTNKNEIPSEPKIQK